MIQKKQTIKLKQPKMPVEVRGQGEKSLGKKK